MYDEQRIYRIRQPLDRTVQPLRSYSGKIFQLKVIFEMAFFYFNRSVMNWIPLHSEEQLEEIRERSARRPQVIFKHSTRCPTSRLVMGRLEKAPLPANIDFYYLDLLNYRPISNKIAETFGVDHESPQVLVIRDGKCVFEESHLGITADTILEQAA